MEDIEDVISSFISSSSNKSSMKFLNLEGDSVNLSFGDGMNFSLTLSSLPFLFNSYSEKLDEEMFSENMEDELEEVTDLRGALEAIDEMYCTLFKEEEKQNGSDDGSGDGDGGEYEYECDSGDEGFILDDDEEEEERKNKAVEDDFDYGSMGIKSIPNNMNRRLMKDLNNIMKQDTESLGFLIEPKTDESLYRWSVKLLNFEDCPLVDDLRQLESRQSKNYIELEMIFELDYPFSPPFIRVVYPRFQFHTGHVTIGGSICMELLTKSGWMPTNDIEFS